MMLTAQDTYTPLQNLSKAVAFAHFSDYASVDYAFLSQYLPVCVFCPPELSVNRYITNGEQRFW